MKEFEFKDTVDLAAYLLDQYSSIEKNESIVCIEDVAYMSELLKDLIYVSDGFISYDTFDIKPFDYNAYDKELILVMNEDGISIQNLYSNNRYLYYVANMLVIHDTCKQEIIKKCINDKCIMACYYYQGEHDDEITLPNIAFKKKNKQNSVKRDTPTTKNECYSISSTTYYEDGESTYMICGPDKETVELLKKLF